MGDYSPPGSDLVFDVPDFGDSANAEVWFKEFADSLAAAVDGKLSAFVTVTTKVADYVLDAADNAHIVEMNLAGANTLTIPNGLPAGTQVLIVQYGAGQTTIVAGDGVTIRKAYGLKIAARYAACLLYARSSSEWLAIGALTV